MSKTYPDLNRVQPGTYRHYKDVLYVVIGNGINTETEEHLVIYYQQGAPENLFARPASMWHEKVDYEGKTYSRFTLIELKPSQGE